MDFALLRAVVQAASLVGGFKLILNASLFDAIRSEAFFAWFEKIRRIF